MFGSQLNKLKWRIKNDTEVTLNLSSDAVGGSIDETNLSFHINFYQLKQLILVVLKSPDTCVRAF